MFIKLKDLVTGYNLKLKGVIHVGAHHGQEYDDYKACGVPAVVWVEPCAPALALLTERFKNSHDVKIIPCAFGVTAASGVPMFVETVNTGMSNSLMRPVKHLEEHPDIQFPGRENISIRQMDQFAFLRDGSYNFLNMDTQGYELKVLQGGQETLKLIDYVYTEVNREEIYEDCARLEQIDALLSDFDRKEIFWCNGGTAGTWGDAFYVRKGI